MFIDGIGVWSYGLADWPQARAVLRGEQPYAPAAAPIPMPEALHAAERRRAPTTVRLALHVASAACAAARADARQMPSVFASSHGDTEISDYMCAELALPVPALSPTRFHNSVHNAASGYWTIATGCMQPANAVSAGSRSFAAGLMEALALCADANSRVLLVVYDIAAPAKLLQLCPIECHFALALVLNPRRGESALAALLPEARGAEPLMPDFVQALMRANPAAHGLPLLHAVANRTEAAVRLADSEWTIAPC